jgi:hypothetical protein
MLHSVGMQDCLHKITLIVRPENPIKRPLTVTCWPFVRFKKVFQEIIQMERYFVESVKNNSLVFIKVQSIRKTR